MQYRNWMRRIARLGVLFALVVFAAGASGCILVDSSGENSHGTLRCEEGGCDFECRSRERCTVECPGGDCNVDCGEADVCTVGCRTGECSVDCNDAEQCQVDCQGGDCDLLW